jgi:hypothetical protein
MSATVAERVAAGVAYLDEHDPKWWQERGPNSISLSQLDLGNASKCVLGQRCPVDRWLRSGSTRFDAQLRYITRGHGVWSELSEWAASHGFMASPQKPGYYQLTAEWKRVIRARRKGGS